LNSARALHELQASDQQLASRRSEYRRVTRDLETQGGLPSLRERAERARKGELEARLESARLESESAALSERLARLEERLYGGAITNVRELTAIETEHAGAKRELAQVDESSEPAQIAAAEAMKLNEQRQAELEEAERIWGENESQLKSMRRRLGRQCLKMHEERKISTSGLPADALSLYNSLLIRKGGVAVVRVERGVCQGCRVRLPLRELARIRAAGSLVSCSSCGRILLND
jgi:predicted  nucleic acid-binding Zn-ribbon protein